MCRQCAFIDVDLELADDQRLHRHLQSSSIVLIDDGTGGLSREAIGVAIGIHRRQGPGLFEKAYRAPFVHELRKRGHNVRCEVPLALEHEDLRVECAYYMDMVVDDRLVIEVKSVPIILQVHIQPLQTYLRFSQIRVGLLINFNVPILRHGIRRVMLDESGKAAQLGKPKQ